MGDEAGHDGADVGSEGRATVEAEPADPQEHRAEDDVGDVVWAVGKTIGCAVSGALAEHEGVGKGGGAGGDVDWSSTSEVETTHLEGPAVGVPGPAGNRIVDDGGPDEDEDHAWEHATTVSCRADGECGPAGMSVFFIPSSHNAAGAGKNSRDGREHALVDSEQDLWELGASWGWGTEDVPESDRLHVTDVAAAVAE